MSSAASTLPTTAWSICIPRSWPRAGWRRRICNGAPACGLSRPSAQAPSKGFGRTATPATSCRASRSTRSRPPASRRWSARWRTAARCRWPTTARSCSSLRTPRATSTTSTPACWPRSPTRIFRVPAPSPISTAILSSRNPTRSASGSPRCSTATAWIRLTSPAPRVRRTTWSVWSPTTARCGCWAPTRPRSGITPATLTSHWPASKGLTTRSAASRLTRSPSWTTASLGWVRTPVGAASSTAPTAIRPSASRRTPSSSPSRATPT